MKPTKKKNFKEAIILTKILDDGTLLVVDSQTTVRYLNKETLELVSGFKGKINHLRYKNNVVSFSSDGNYFASLSSSCNEAVLYNTKTKKSIAKVDRHQGEASCVGMDPMNRYMFSCGDDGKTFAIDIKSGKLAFTLPTHVDTINDIAFSDNSQWLATASYDKKIQLFNLAMMTPKHKLKVHASAVMKLKFLTKHRLFSIDKNNTAIIWDMYTGKVIHRLKGIHDNVTQVTVGSDNKFLFLGTSLGYVLVYDLQNYELLSKKYIKLSATVTSMTFDEDTQELILGLDDGEVLFYDIYHGEEFLKELLQKRELSIIQSRIDDNPLLEYTKIYYLIANLWEKTVERAKIALQNNDRNTAVKLFESFRSIPSKNTIIQKIMLEYADFDKFTELAKSGKIPLAYGLANLHPLYKESKIYKALELKWQKSFILAQKYSLDPKGLDRAREVLAPYRGVSDKTKLMQELFTQGEVYKRFRIAIGQKNFKIAFALIKQHPFLKEFPEYTSIMNYADTLYMKSQQLINSGDTHSAVKMLRVLSDFSDFTAEVKEIMKDIESKQKFFKAVSEEDLSQAYTLLDQYDELQLTEDGKKLQDDWNSDITAANGAAVYGNAKEITKVLQKYMKIQSKYMSIGTIFAWSYMVQLENALKKKEDRLLIENGIKNYILSFGLQDQIESFFTQFQKRYPETKLNIELQTKGSLRMWRPSMIVNSILE